MEHLLAQITTQYPVLLATGRQAKLPCWSIWHKRRAVAGGVTTGTGPTAFSPSENCTRAQIVTFLYRAMAD